jgi:DNA adenine methylase
LIPEFTGTYYEPFLGSGAVYLHLLPEKAVLNDLNKDIINIWKLVRSDPEYIIQEIEKFKKTFLHLDNVEKLKMCKELVSKMDTLKGKERTVKYLLMVYCSFNGTVLYNGKFIISGLYIHLYQKNICHLFAEDYTLKLAKVKKLLKDIKIENKDYKNILANTKQGDFVFLDPPYIEDKKYSFSYNKNEEFDPKELKQEVQKLDKKEVKWMMTQIDSPQVRELFKGYKMKIYDNTSTFGIKKNNKKEVIITNY